MSSMRLELLTTELPYGHSSFSTLSSRCVNRPNHILLTRHSKLTPGQTGQADEEIKDPLRSDTTMGHRPFRNAIPTLPSQLTQAVLLNAKAKRGVSE